MAETLSVTEMIPNKFEPKRKNRWVFAIEGIDAFILKTASRPSFSIQEQEINYINAKRYIAGKTSFESINVTLHDPIAPSGAQQVMEWIRTHYESVSGRAGYADFYKRDCQLKMLDPVGTVVELWGVLAGTEEGVLMVESEAQELPESTMLDAVNFGHEFYQNFIKEVHTFAGKTEIKPFEVPSLPDFYEGLQKDIAGKIADPIREAYGLVDKQERSQKLNEIRSSIIDNVEADQVLAATTIIKDIEKDVVRGDIIKNKSRIDGRKLDEVRQITCELDILPRAHGSSLFTRGETQALVVTTLGTGDDEQMIDSLDPMHKQHFMLHYNFPPYSVGEVGRMGATGRREIGHGKLAWRAVHPMLPKKEDFPYTLRLVSEITESNGSSSMATVCGSSLALMAAGVPIKKHIGGIAMGLIKE